MIKPRQLIPLVFSLVVATATPLAQPDSGEAPPKADDPAPGTGQQTDADKSVDKSEDRGQPARNQSPVEYRPSEEISEDLPVSFPVDI